MKVITTLYTNVQIFKNKDNKKYSNMKVDSYNILVHFMSNV